jgi:lipoprotein NlpD
MSAPSNAAASTAGEPAAIDSRPETHVVERGQTLYAIALDYGLDYRELAAWNGLPDWQPVAAASAGGAANGLIARSIDGNAVVDAQPLAPPPAIVTSPRAIKLAWSENALARLRAELGLPPLPPREPAPTPAVPPGAAAKPPARTVSPSTTAVVIAPSTTPKPASATPPAIPPPGAAREVAPSATSALSWIWPVRGKLLHGFNEGPNPKGVAIAGELGQPVYASASGKVVYSGSGLRGYGKLVIIKHSDTYLSVYAHNRELLVKEGDRVVRGQRIASMGDSDSNRVALHFEIRRYGTPVDPLTFLPQGGG